MNPQTRQFYILIHVIFAGYFLPAAIVFAITGGLYTFGVKGEYKTDSFEVPLQISEKPNLDELTALTKNLLAEKNLLPPSGDPSIKKAGTSWQFEWTGSKYDFTLDPTSVQGSYKAAIKKTSLHRFFVQLHKAKGGLPFKFMAGGLSIALLLLFASGVALAFASPALKKKMYISLALGAASFLGLALFS